MAVSLHGAGVAHAKSLIAGGHVDRESAWSFSAADSDALLGDPPNWSAYSRWFFGIDSAEGEQTKGHYKYPFGKGGKVYASALRAIASRAAQNNESAISDAASAFLKELDGGKSVDPVQRAYSVLQIKSLNVEQREVTGIATTPEVDRMGDIVEPLGVTFRNPSPLLLYHDAEKPVGQVSFDTPTKNGVKFTARIASIAEMGALRDRVEEAWQSIKAGLIQAVSIGFRPIEYAFMETGGIHFQKSEVLELSLVSIPANASAVIQTIKSLDTHRPAASGTAGRVSSKTAPGVTGTSHANPRVSAAMKTTQEKIQAFKAEKDAKLAKMNELMAGEDVTTLDAEKETEFDTLQAEVAAIDKHLAKLETLAQFNKSATKPVAGSTPEEGSNSRGESSPVVALKREEPKGVAFARAAMCLAAARGNPMAATSLADKHYKGDERVVSFVKAAVTTGTTSDGGGPIVQYQDIVSEFVEYLRPGSIIGKFGQGGIPGLHRIGFNTRTVVQTAGGSGYWVGQGKPAPMTKATFSTVTVDFTKVATIAALTKEEVRFSSPSAELRVRDELARAINARLDQDFIDPTNAGSANVKPASILNGIAAVAASGTAASNVQSDFASLMAKFAAANLDPMSPVLIMSKTLAINLSLMLTSLGQPQYPNLTMNGGNLFGIPVIVSEYLNSLGSPGTGMIALVDANEVFLADDGNVTVEASDQASVEMLDASLVQDATAGTATSLVSAWQSGLLLLKAEREISWKLRRSGVGAYYISNAAYAA